MRWARWRRYKCSDPADNRVMDKHYHVWVRSGVVFMLMGEALPEPGAREQATPRSCAPTPADRLVLGCNEVPGYPTE